MATLRRRSAMSALLACVLAGSGAHGQCNVGTQWLPHTVFDATGRAQALVTQADPYLLFTWGSSGSATIGAQGPTLSLALCRAGQEVGNACCGAVLNLQTQLQPGEHRLYIDTGAGFPLTQVDFALPAPPITNLALDPGGNFSGNGAIATSTEGAYYRYVTPNLAGTLTVVTEGFGTGFDTDLFVFGANGTTLIHSDTGPGNGVFGRSVSPGEAFYFLVRGNIGESNTGTFTIGVDGPACPTPIVTIQPQPASVCNGQPAMFTVGATGAIDYQWRRNGVNLTNIAPYSGVATPTLSISAATAAQAGTFDCAVTNSCGTTISNGAALTVQSAPSITQQPQPQSVCSGQPAQFEVQAAGATGFQWRRNGGNLSNTGPYSGVTTPTLSIGAVTINETGTFDCVVSNTCASTPSAGAALSILAAPSITAHPQPLAVCPGGPAGFSVQATNATGYLWRRNGVNLTNSPPFSGVTTPMLSISAVTSGELGSYDCIVSNACASTLSGAGALTLGSPATITQQPEPLTVCSGQPAGFTVAATNATGYQWRRNGTNLANNPPYSGVTTPALAIGAATAAQAGTFDCLVSSGCGPILSLPALLTVSAAPAITQHPSAQSVCVGGATSFSVAALNATAYQWQRNGVNISGPAYGGINSPTLQILGAAPGMAGSYRCQVSSACGSVNIGAALLTVNACEVRVLHVRAGAPSGGDGLSWATAYQDLQAALDYARAHPTVAEVWIAEGIYKPDRGTQSRVFSFDLVTGVGLYGGFAGHEATRDARRPAIHPSILDGDLLGNNTPDNQANRTDDTIHIVAVGMAEGAVLDGLVIRHGWATTPANVGGGIHNPNGRGITVRDCTFIRNDGTRGSAVFSAGSPVFERCVFMDNRNVEAGVVNLAGAGQPRFVNCLFNGNYAHVNGGAVAVEAQSSPVFINCTFFGGWARTGAGGAIHADVTSSVTLSNSLVWNNRRGEFGAGVPDQLGGSGAFTVAYSCIEGGYPGQGNTSADPQLVDPSGAPAYQQGIASFGVVGRDVRLSAGSPALDTGSNAAVPPGATLDVGLRGRIADGDRNGAATVDPGAYETQCGLEWAAVGGGADSRLRALLDFDADGPGPGAAALYAGGLFGQIGGVPASRIARWDGQQWAPLGPGVNGEVYCLAPFDTGGGPELYIGGDFTQSGATVASGIARWDGSAWQPVGVAPSYGVVGGLRALAAYGPAGTRALYAGGTFDDGSGFNNANNIARWDGSGWTKLGSGASAGVNAFVTSLAVYDEGAGERLFVGGGFTTAGGTPRVGIARWDGSAWSSVGGGMNTTVSGLTVFDDDGPGLRRPGLYATGPFENAGGVTARFVARWDGVAWSALGAGLNDWGTSLAPSQDQNRPLLYVGGKFGTAGGAPASRVAAWDGTAWRGLAQGLDGWVHGVASTRVGSPTPRLVAGGEFTGSGALPVPRVGSWSEAECVVTCYPDCDQSGALNVNDYICFQTKFALGDPYADCDGNGIRNVNDYICFQTRFALGCP